MSDPNPTCTAWDKGSYESPLDGDRMEWGVKCGHRGVWEVCQTFACGQPGHLEQLIEICEKASPGAPHEVRRIL